jgi:hypothetical protein
MSAKKRAEIAETRDLRAQWLEAVFVCEVCLDHRARHVHEIPAGAHRQRSVRDPRCWLAVCAECHDLIQGTPFDSQLGLAVDASKRAINNAVGRNVV